MPKGTIRLHRVFRTNPERVYRAFLDADAMAKWLPPYGFTCKVHHMDSKVGGSYKMSFMNFSTGHDHSFGGEYRELVPFETIRYTDSFDDPNLSGEMQTTLTLKEVSCGTELTVVQEGCLRLFRSRCAISAGRSHSRNLRSSSSPRFQGDEVTPNQPMQRTRMRWPDRPSRRFSGPHLISGPSSHRHRAADGQVVRRSWDPPVPNRNSTLSE